MHHRPRPICELLFDAANHRIDNVLQLCEACNFGCNDGSLNPNGGNLACNYDPTANADDGSCEYVAPTELPSQGGDLVALQVAPLLQWIC